MQPRPAASSAPAAPGQRRWPIYVAAIAVVLVIAIAWFWPRIHRAFVTVSTDDAYVNGHVTVVAPRVAGQVIEVLVEDNNRVRKGQLLVRLDPKPYRVQVNFKTAAEAAAAADLKAAVADVYALESQGAALRWKLQSAIEAVNQQIATLRAAVATLHSRQASRDRARSEFNRVNGLVARGGATAEELESRREDLHVAEATAEVALQDVYRQRVALGLPPQPKNGDLTQVPADLNQTFSAVRTALADLLRIRAQLGLPPLPYEATPEQALADFRQRDASGDIDRLLKQLAQSAPSVLQAQAKLQQAKSDLEQAKLNLGYCEVTAEIDGVVTRRTVNPGSTVAIGQSLMAVRSLTDIWVDANFKETQLADLRIGQRVDLFADAYPGRTFQGRITGFTMGTGQTLALLPPQNASGNYVKVVQRLPVRIDFIDYNPEEVPLFAGLSMVPYVYANEPATGPNAGQYLQPRAPSGAKP